MLKIYTEETNKPTRKQKKNDETLLNKQVESVRYKFKREKGTMVQT